MRTICLLLLAFMPAAYGSNLEANKAKLSKLINLYQNEFIARYGSPLRFEIFEDESLQATSLATPNYHILVFTGVLKLPTPQMIFIACHEMGHFLGHIPLEKVEGHSDPTKPELKFSVEGEADYFAGRCFTRFYAENKSAKELAYASTKTILDMMYEESIDYRLALNQEYDGIDSMYPSAPCRLLSVIQGAAGLERPKCWYNPKN